MPGSMAGGVGRETEGKEASEGALVSHLSLWATGAGAHQETL